MAVVLGADDGAGVVRADAVALHQLVIKLPVFLVTGVVLGIDELKVLADANAQAKPFDACLHHIRAPYQDGFCYPFVDHRLHGAQHTLVLTLGVNQALGELARAFEDRFHEKPGTEDELAEALLVGIEVLDRPGCHPTVHGCLGDGRSDLDDQARVERLGDEIFRAELEVFAAVGEGHDLRGFGHGQIGDRLDAGELHFLVDDGSAAIEGAAEDEGEAKNVVDLVRVIRAPGGHHHVGPRRHRLLRLDLGIGIGECQNQGLFSHALDHVRGEDTGSRKAEENVGAVQ